MWIDERGSEVLPIPECHRLLAVGAEEHRHGHLGVAQPGAPLVLPLDYAVYGPDVVVRIGEGLFHRLDGHLVAFQVDGVTAPSAGEAGAPEQVWSVLLQGLAIEETDQIPSRHIPHPRVAEPGRRVVLIRGDVVTGRRFSLPSAPSALDGIVKPAGMGAQVEVGPASSP